MRALVVHESMYGNTRRIADTSEPQPSSTPASSCRCLWADARRDASPRCCAATGSSSQPPQSFLVDKTNHLLPGELDQAERWGRDLANRVSTQHERS